MTLPTDKLLHILTCYCISITLGTITNWWLGLLLALLIGIAKELYDLSSGRGSAEWPDLLADFTGAVLGSVSPFLFT